MLTFIREKRDITKGKNCFGEPMSDDFLLTQNFCMKHRIYSLYK